MGNMKTSIHYNTHLLISRVNEGYADFIITGEDGSKAFESRAHLSLSEKLGVEDTAREKFVKLGRALGIPVYSHNGRLSTDIDLEDTRQEYNPFEQILSEKQYTENSAPLLEPPEDEISTTPLRSLDGRVSWG